MAETTVTWSERSKLKGVSKQIFRRLIMDKDRETVSFIQFVILFFVLAGGIVLVALAIWALSSPTGVSASIANALGHSARVEASHVTGAMVVLSLLFILIAARNHLKDIIERAFDAAGWLLILKRRVGYGSPEARKNLDHVKYWLRQDPDRIAAEVADYRGETCEEILPVSVRELFRKLSDDLDPTNFVIARGLFERKYAFNYFLWRWRTPRPYKDDPEKVGGRAGWKNADQYFIAARALRNAIKMSICFDALNVELRDESAGGGRWWWDYYSKHDYQQVPLWDEHDLPLRFRTASPHLKWPDQDRPDSDGELPLFRAFSGLENPQGLPLLLLELKTIIAEMPHAVADLGLEAAGGPLSEPERRLIAARALSALAKFKVKLISRRDFKTMQPILGRDATDAPFLMRLDNGSREFSPDRVDDLLGADWGARWDPARVEWSSIDAAGDSELLQAIAIFINAINLAMRSKPGEVAGAGRHHHGHGNSHSIVLNRGDVLFVDNRRTLVGRFEHHLTDAMALRKLMLRQPAEWWIRRFYGFRKTKRSEASGDRTEHRFSNAAEPVTAMPAETCSF